MDKQEPFIYIREDTEQPFGGYEHCGQHEPGAFPVYTAPPVSDYHEGWEEGFKAAKREWVGLSDEELSLLWLEYHGDNFIADGRIINYEKAIEAKLKEKNGG